MQYIMETIIIDLIKAKRPPHPMKKAIEWWHDATEDWTDEELGEIPADVDEVRNFPIPVVWGHSVNEKNALSRVVAL